MKREIRKQLNQDEFKVKIIEDLGIVESSNGIRKRWAVFECSICKENFTANAQSVRRTNQLNCMSCGRRRGKTTHGKSRTRLYRIWKAIQNRCYKIKEDDKNYNSYKGVGVFVCDEWRKDFMSFYDWSLENGYKEDLELDKDIKCDKLNITPKIYSPETCLWVTKSENNCAKFN